jgi:hypothetical protein
MMNKKFVVFLTPRCRGGFDDETRQLFQESNLNDIKPDGATKYFFYEIDLSGQIGNKTKIARAYIA